MINRSSLTLVALVTALTFASAASSAATLLHQYSFNSGVLDTVGGQNGTLLNGAFVSGSALVLDGVDDFVQLGAHLVPTSGSYSVSLFANQAATQNIHVEFISQGLTGGLGYYIGHDPNRVIRASDSWVNTGVPMPVPGAWHHYALTVDSGAGKSTLYVDGAQQAILNTAIVSTNGGSDTRFGAQFQNFGEFFDGQLDEIMIFSGALTSSEVSSLASVKPAVVPLPATGILLISALGSLASLRRRASIRSLRLRT